MNGTKTACQGQAAPLLEARNLGRLKKRTSGWIFSDVSLTVRPGDRIVLCGPTGTGKTVLLRTLCHLDPPDCGEILWRGSPVADCDVPAFRRRMTYLPQKASVFPGTVESNLRLPYTLRGYRGSTFDRDSIIEQLALCQRDAAFLERSSQDLSGGEAQIVCLLRTLQLAPDLIMLDEPTASLDGETTLAVESLVARWLQELPGSRATLWVSHDQAQAQRVADRQLEIGQGRLIGGD